MFGKPLKYDCESQKKKEEMGRNHTVNPKEESGSGGDTGRRNQGGVKRGVKFNLEDRESG